MKTYGWYEYEEGTFGDTIVKKDITWNDITSATQSELKKSYKMNDRQLEQSLRKHLDGANHVERRQVYQELYGKRK